MSPVSKKPRPSSEADTPIHDQIKADLETANPEDVTLFEEDDDPLSHVGEIVEEDANNTERKAN